MSIKSDKWICRMAQVLLFESDEICETFYKDRGGKYQGQVGLALPEM